MKADNAEENKGSFYISPKLFIALAALSHAAVTLPFAYFLNIWMDEASTLYTTRQGFFETFQNALADERQAPLYFLILSLWRALDDSVFFARLFSIVCSLLAIKFFYDAARKFFTENEAKFIALLFALHPYLIWTSLEIRGYALVILLSVLLLKFFEKGYFRRTETESENTEAKKCRIFYVLLSIFALYTNYYLGFLIAGNFCALVVLRRWRAAKIYFLQMLPVGLAILPLLWIIKTQFAVNTGGFVVEKSFYTGAKTLWNNALNLVFPTELYPPDEPTTVSVVRIWLMRAGILAVIFALVKNKFRALDEKVLMFGAISATISVFFLAVYFAVGVQYVVLRHVAPLFAPLGLFVFALLSEILPRRSWLIFVAVFAFLFPYSVYKSYPQAAKRGDWIRVARFVEANEKPDQPIIVFQTYDALSLPFYYRGANRILPDEKFFAWHFQDSLKSENALRAQTDFVVSKIPPDAPEIWLATEEICQNPETAAACRPLENFVEAHYTVELERDFYYERLRLLRKK